MFSGHKVTRAHTRGGDYRGEGGTGLPKILEELKGFRIIKIQFLFSFSGLRPLIP